jgi:hypothetical protein
MFLVLFNNNWGHVVQIKCVRMSSGETVLIQPYSVRGYEEDHG